MKFKYLILLICFGGCKSNENPLIATENEEVRKEISLNQEWETILSDSLSRSEKEFIKDPQADVEWKNVNVPHNWDQYYGYRRMLHGNLHGTAWYKKSIELDEEDQGKRHFLFFEGVGSYATVWVNGEKVGRHEGGRTTFTFDITEALDFSSSNQILVKAEHPAFIADLPWVCGGCSGEWGFSEGSQPLGIFRPVTLVVTEELRIEPFGIHIWNRNDISRENAVLHTNSEIKNYGNEDRSFSLVHELWNREGDVVVSTKKEVEITKGEQKFVKLDLPEIEDPHLWSPKDPYLYELSTSLYENGKIVDHVRTPYGIRSISWPIGRAGEDNRFFINGNPVFINGTCGYEHSIGRSHAFTDEQIETRIEQIKAAGFNSFREAHQPHNLQYQKHFDEAGMLFWSQMSAHIWYDTPEFKENFKRLLRQFIKERRNSPSIIMWGLQNESQIPEEVAREYTKIIREMDPTASEQRLVTTCNGGKGTDWNVIQNWSGTYGGDPYNYAEELTTQLLNGEYGAWRTKDLHTEGDFDQEGIYSENRFSQLMEIKVREAESVRDKVVGQYQWLFNSHENPGRIQNGEGFRDIDRVGPVNYKGLYTIWGEPSDAYYMYRANYVSNKESPMVYIVSHSWPNRWKEPGIKDRLEVYSNCDEVEIFNDVNNLSFGRKKNPGRGKHFQWNNVDVQYNVLYAVGYVDGKEVARDYIVLDNLPQSPNFEKLIKDEGVLEPEEGFNYVYRVNCGGPEITDSQGEVWSADIHKTKSDTWGSLSWTDHFDNLPAYYASQRRIHDPIAGTKDWSLFQNFRYGRDKLRYEFPVPNGNYRVELYFVEPWYGTGGGMDCSGWRKFDVAVNESVILNDFDIWEEAGHDKALKKVFNVEITDGQLDISFPEVSSGQALISAIAIATRDQDVKPAPPSPKNIVQTVINDEFEHLYEVVSWLDIGHQQYQDANVSFTKLPYRMYSSDWLRFSQSLGNKKIRGSFISPENTSIYVLLDQRISEKPDWLRDYGKIEEEAENSSVVTFDVFTKEVKEGEEVFFGSNGKGNGEEISMYTIAVVPQYEMSDESKSNIRAIIALQAEDAPVEGVGIETGFFDEEDYFGFTENTPNKITFEVSPGVAAIYLLRFSYMNLGEKPIEVNLTIKDANGIVVRDGKIEFPPNDEKWRILNTTSGGFINAGTYKITLESDEMKGLRLESFEFQ